MERRDINLGNSRTIPGAEDLPDPYLESILEEHRKQGEILSQRLLDAAQAEAKKLLDETNHLLKQAQDERQQAENQKDDILKHAYLEGEKAGFEKGYQDGLNKASEEVTELLARCQSLADRAHDAEYQVLKSFRKDGAELMQAILTKILGDTWAEDPKTTLLSILDQSIDALRLSGTVQVVINADTLHQIQSFSEETQQALLRMNRYEFIADDQLGPQDIYIIGRNTQFNLSPSQQTLRLIQAISTDLPITEPEGLPAREPLAQKDPLSPELDLSEHVSLEVQGESTLFEKPPLSLKEEGETSDA